MLAIKPIYEKKVKDQLCSLCGIESNPDSYAYFAADVNDDATKINFIIGVCTFIIKGDDHVIESLCNAPGVEDDEAMMIMARAVMNFMYRAGVKSVRMNMENVSSNVAEKLGFTEKNGMTIDLEEFYRSPCKYTAKSK